MRNDHHMGEGKQHYQKIKETEKQTAPENPKQGTKISLPNIPNTILTQQ